jgi:hypothetical protein
MAADGTWTITMQTPIGERTSTMTFKEEGATLTGTAAAEGNSTDIYEGSVVADMLKWKVNISNPMPLTLSFSGTISGDNISGEVDSGSFGSWPFSGARA